MIFRSFFVLPALILNLAIDIFFLICYDKIKDMMRGIVTAIMLITFVFGLLLSQAACMAFNIVLSSVVNRTFNLIQVGLKEIGCIVALGLVVAAFAMLLPLSRINRMKPIDAIRK